MERITARLPAFEKKPGKLRDQKKQTDKQKTQNTCLFVFSNFKQKETLFMFLELEQPWIQMPTVLS